MKLKYFPEKKEYIWRGAYADRHLPKNAGFLWNSLHKYWYTKSIFNAYVFKAYAVEDITKQHCTDIENNLLSSKCKTVKGKSIIAPIIAPVNCKFFPFQEAGIDYICQKLKERRVLLLADEQGLGKSIQAIGVANQLNFQRLLIICPASLRHNWGNEIWKWHKHNPGVDIILSGRQKISSTATVITSYELSKYIVGQDFDFIIIDEAHFLKNKAAIRTKTVLNKIVGSKITCKTPVLFLTGTPIPNNAAEFFPILNKCAPDLIEGKTYWQFLNTYHHTLKTVFGTKITGYKNTEALNLRLRGSGFMTRRLKKNVLDDLPAKSYKMVVFSPTGKTRAIIKREKDFNVYEIAKTGLRPGTVEAESYAEARRLMGTAKVPQSIEYIKNLLDYEIEKIVVFAHHVEVVELMVEGLKEYHPVAIYGKTSINTRQTLVNCFQTDKNVRVFIGNSAAETGITLTAAKDVVILEPDFVPGKNEQKIDRIHRIGQTKGVIVHQLVVEGSMDIEIYQIAARKREGIAQTLQ